MVTWTKPVPGTPSANWHLIGDDGWILCKVIGRDGPRYMLTHKGEIVCIGTRQECDAAIENRRVA